MQGKCETCRWWGRELEHDHDMPYGSCRVKSPVVGTAQIRVSSDPFATPKPTWPHRAAWLWTAFDDWCGEHQHRDAPDA